MTVRPSLVSAVLFVAVLGVSLSGPLVRLSTAPAVAIAAWRVAFSLVVVAVALLATGSWRQWRSMSRDTFGVAILGGVFLALHFWTWNASVQMTTVAASVVLVNTMPLIVAILSVVWLREPPTGRQWIGIAVAMAGAFVVAFPDVSQGGAGALRGRAALGDALALAGAAFAAIYYVIGRRLRAQLDLWPYVALVYGACLIALLVIALLTGTPLAPYPSRDVGIFALLALGPMLIGHTGMNWALKYARAYQVNIVLLGEPIGATVLAAFLPGIREQPGLFTLIGGAFVLSGVVLAEQKSRR